MTSDGPYLRLSQLTEREKETLRLLIGGHDAKSMARTLGLSVHTVNERLRDARRKLQVSSSREAARLLADQEDKDPNSVGDKPIGVAPGTPAGPDTGPSMNRLDLGRPLVWLVGGIFVMSIVAITLAVTSLALTGEAPAARTPEPAPVQSVAETAESRLARDWLVLLDARRWNDSWNGAGSQFKTISQADWATTAQSVRDPVGRPAARTLQSVMRTTSLPGAPAGEYQVIQFQTRFEHKADAVETVILSREGAAWKVNGYFIR